MKTREQIYEQLNEQIPYLKRRHCTPRVLSESGVDSLLDELILIQREEEFDRVFSPEIFDQISTT